MTGKDILRVCLDVLLLVCAGYIAIRVINYALGLLAAGASMLLALVYMFAPVIIIVLLIIILIKMNRK